VTIRRDVLLRGTSFRDGQKFIARLALLICLLFVLLGQSGTRSANIDAAGALIISGGSPESLAPAAPSPGGGAAWSLSPLDLLGDTIEGINFDENRTNNIGFASIPPDPMGAVGPSHVVSVVNRSIEFHTKEGVEQLSQSLANFFSPLSPLRVFDPKVIYDQYSNRFVVVAMDSTKVSGVYSADTSRILLAASDDDVNRPGFYGDSFS
jgi:hypothetical protein